MYLKLTFKGNQLHFQLFLEKEELTSIPLANFHISAHMKLTPKSLGVSQPGASNPASLSMELIALGLVFANTLISKRLFELDLFSLCTHAQRICSPIYLGLLNLQGPSAKM